MIDKRLCCSLWGDSGRNRVVAPFVGLARGLLSIWDTNCLQLRNQYVSVEYIGLEGVCQENGREVVIENVYAPCNKTRGRRIWEELREKKANSYIDCWCLIGNFNCVRWTYGR